MKAYLEKIDKEWFDDFVYISKYPLQSMGYEIVPFNGEDSDSLYRFSIDPSADICIGSVEATTTFFNICNVPVPQTITYPDQLRKYLHRDIKECAIADIRDNYPCFIKPSKDIKLFTGDILNKDSDLDLLKSFSKIDDTTPIYMCNVVNFISEYRVFVSNGVIRGIKHYRGDFTRFIDITEVRKMINEYTNCPSAYTLDVGLDVLERTLLVEVNDMWSIGSYGLDGKTYALLCARRMKEILKNKELSWQD